MFGFIGSWLWYKLSLNLVGAWYLIREQVTWSRLSWGNPPKKVVFDGQAFAGGGGHRLGTYAIEIFHLALVHFLFVLKGPPVVLPPPKL